MLEVPNTNDMSMVYSTVYMNTQPVNSVAFMLTVTARPDVDKQVNNVVVNPSNASLHCFIKSTFI